MGETVEQCYARLKAHGLTLKQQSAVDLLVAGNNDTKTAELLCVARTTVSKWRLYDPAFQVALQARRADVWGSSLDQLRALIPKAIARIAQELDSKLYSYEAARALMRLIKIPSLVPTGPNSAEQVIEDLTTERMMARRHACMEDLGKIPGMKEDSPAPAFEREDTRKDVLGVLAQRLSDVGPTNSDSWEVGMKAQVPPATEAPAAGNKMERAATPVPPEPASPAGEGITPAVEGAADAAGNKMERPATPVPPEPASPAGEGITPAVEGAADAAGNKMERPATPYAPEPASPAGEGITPAAEGAANPAGNRMERPATPYAPEPAAVPAGAVANEKEHSVTPTPAEPANLAVGVANQPESTSGRQVGNLPHGAEPANLAVGNDLEARSVTPEPEAAMDMVTPAPRASAGSVPAQDVEGRAVTPPDMDRPTTEKNAMERSTTPAAAQSPGSTATGTAASVAAGPQPTQQEVTAWTIASLKAIRAELAAKDAQDKL